MIVATVGHVDHGKTALVRALTGVDTDRLPEEKARGLSIELGFAYRAAQGGRVIGFVDTPGHERFVHNMVAGVAGIHRALLVVAADDGPMPQTREHLAILDLLGVASATVVVTKIDRVDAQRAAEVESETAALVAATRVAQAGTFRVCAPRGEGVEALWTHLEDAARELQAPPPRGNFRLAVDRCFTLDGAGLVVTGTVFAGSISAGDRVAVLPRGVHARVRELRAQDRKAEVARTGERCALNLAGAGIHRDDIARGDWIVAENLHLPTDRIDVDLRVLRRRELVEARARVHVHIGAKETTGRIVPLERAPVEPGSTLAQIVLDQPLGALWGDRLVLRDWAAKQTFAGGTVLDPFPPSRGRAADARLAALARMRTGDAAESLRGLLDAQPDGVDLERFVAARNLSARERDELLASVEIVAAASGDESLAFAPAHWSAARERILAAVDAWHDANPESWGPGEIELRRLVDMDALREAFAARVRALVETGELRRMGTRLHRPAHRPVLAGPDLELWQRVEPLLVEGGVKPPSVGDLSARLGLAIPVVESFLKRAAQLGFLLQVAGNRFFAPQAVSALAVAARDLAQGREDGLFSAAEYRDRTGIGRNLTIDVLEYFDRCGLTRRAGQGRKLVRPPERLFGGAAQSDHGRVTSPVGRTDFKSGEGAQAFPGVRLPPLPPHVAKGS